MIDFVRHNNLNLSPNFPTSEDMSKAAYLSSQRGDSFFSSNRFGQAKEYYEQSLQAYRTVHDLRGSGISLLRLGRVAEILGEYAQARAAYEESLEVFQSLSDTPGIARSKAHLGNLGWAQGDYVQAERYLKESLSLYHASGDISGEAWIHDLMGNLYLAMREDQKAQGSYQKGFSLVEGLGINLENKAWHSYHLGDLSFFREQVEEAKEHFGDALKAFITLKDDLGQVAASIHLGEIACVRGDFAEAEKNLQKAVQIVIPTQCKPLLADALTGVAQLLKAKGDERKAISILMVAVSHPTCRQQTKDRMVALAVSLEARLSQQEVESSFQWAKSVSLEEIAIVWCASASSKG